MRAFLVATLLLLPLAAPLVGAVTPTRDIASTGPLADVWIGSDLSCQVRHVRDSLYELFPPGAVPGDCGTFVAAGGVLYAPDFANHVGSATGSIGAYTPFAAVSQSAITGSGSAADPYKVVTMVTLPGSALAITQTDLYVVGNEFYHTDVTIRNTGATSAAAILYRAADCYLGGSDSGYGAYDPATGIVACTQNAGNVPAGRVEEWIPRSPGSRAYHHTYSEVWRYIGTRAELPNTCQCGSVLDNGAGLSWNVTIPAGGNVTRSHDLRFDVPLTGDEVLASCRAAAVLVEGRDPANGKATIALAESRASTRANGGIPANATLLAPPASPDAHADAQEAGATYAGALQVSVKGAFSRCDVDAGSASRAVGALAYGRAGVASVEIALCAGCPPIARVEAVDFEMLAEGRANATSARYACDTYDVFATQTITASCQAASFQFTESPSPPAPAATLSQAVVMPEAAGPASASGLQVYTGAAAHVQVNVNGLIQDVYVGYVQVGVYGLTGSPPSYVPNGPCALAQLPCQ